MSTDANALGAICGWSFPVGRIGTTPIRIGWLLPLWCLFDLVRFSQMHRLDLIPWALVVPPLTMLAHGLAHVGAARMVGGRVTMLTLSVLNEDDQLQVPSTRWALWWSSAAGPLASAALMACAWLLVEHSAGTTADVAGYIMWTNAFVVLFNLLACAPFDGRRWWRGLLWRLLGLRNGLRGTVVLGYVSAILLMTLAVWYQQFMLVFLGVFGLLFTINDHRELDAGNDPVLGLNPTHAPSGLRQATKPGWLARWRSRRQERAEARQTALADAEQVILDRLLAKVSAEGLPSLTAGEREQLQAISRRQRDGA